MEVLSVCLPFDTCIFSYFTFNNSSSPFSLIHVFMWQSLMSLSVPHPVFFPFSLSSPTSSFLAGLWLVCACGGVCVWCGWVWCVGVSGGTYWLGATAEASVSLLSLTAGEIWARNQRHPKMCCAGCHAWGHTTLIKTPSYHGHLQHTHTNTQIQTSTLACMHIKGLNHPFITFVLTKCIMHLLLV